MSSFSLFQLIISLILVVKLNNGLTTPQNNKKSIISTKLSTFTPKTSTKTTSSSHTSTRKTSTLTTTTTTTSRTTTTTTTKKTSTSTSSSKKNILVTTNLSSILVYDLNKGVLVKSILVAEEQAYLLLYASQYLIGSTSKGKISVWDLATSKVTCVFSNINYVQDVIDGDRFASSNYFDYSIWNYKTCSLIYKNVVGSLIFSIVYLGNGLLASYSDDGLIRVLNLRTLKLEANFLAQIWGDSLFFSDKYLSLLGWDTIYLWNMNSFSLYKAITYSDLSAVNSKLFMYNDFILTNQINDVLVFSIADGSLLKKLDVKIGGHSKRISDAVFFKNNGLLATAGEDNLIKVWDLNKIALKYTFNLAEVGQGISKLRMLAVGNDYLLSYGETFQTKLWNMKNGALVYKINAYFNNRVVINTNENFIL